MSKAIVLVVLLAAVAIPEVIGATTHTVGGSQGWTQGVDYDTWAAGETFTVGDTLVFSYSGLHTVDQVSKDDCNANSIKTYSGGSTSIPLSTAGPLYFICATPGHCAGGMKLAITVAAAPSGGTPPTTPSTPSPPGTATPKSPPPPPASTPGGNAASGVSCSKIVAGLSFVLAMVGMSMF